MAWRKPWRLAAACVFVGAVVTVSLASAAGAGRAGSDAPAAVQLGAKKPFACTQGQVGVTFLGRTTCRRLRAVPDTGDQRPALFRAAILQDLSGLKTRRGTAIPSFSKIAGGRVGRARARIVAALPQALAWADSHIREEKGRSRSAAPCGAIDGGKDSTKIGGFELTLTAGGDLTVSGDLPGGYRIEVFVGKAVPGCALDLPACPMADGTLDGKDAHANTIIVKVTRNGQILQSTTIKVRSTQTMKGKVADDAKLDTMSLQDAARETTTVILPGDRVTLLLTVRRSTEVDMRSGAPKPGSTKVDARLQIVGATQTFQAGVGANVVKKYSEEFSEIISEEVGRYRSRETAWQTPGACAKLTFDPPSNGTRKLKELESGQVTGKVESNQGGVAAKGKWKVTSQANGVFTPPTADGGTAPFQYLVTLAGDNIRLTGAFRATSTAGVAEGTWSQPTQGEDALFFKILAATYNANHNASWSGSGLPCAGDASAQEQVSSGPVPFDPAATKFPGLDGFYSGQIVTGPDPLQAPRGGIIHGCDLTTGPPPDPCDVTVSLTNPVQVGVIVEIKPGATAAKVTWVLPVVDVNDDEPPVPCYRAPPVATPVPEVREEPFSKFLSPGVQTLSVTRNVSITAGPPTATQSIGGVTNASITFQRVNADGSPFTG